MAKLFSIFNRRKNTVQPLLSRQRQAFKGSIDSEKINLYFDQFLVDIARLHKNLENLSNSYSEVSNLLDSRLDSATPRLLYI